MLETKLTNKQLISGGKTDGIDCPDKLFMLVSSHYNGFVSNFRDQNSR